MPSFTIPSIIHATYRTIQLALALTVVGLYGVDLHAANHQHKYSDGKWVFAVVVASLSAPTALVYIISSLLIPAILHVPFLFIWDTILFILWIALFGLFGNLYIHEHPEGNKGIQRMKNAVWVDLVNALLWLVSASGMTVFWFKNRNSRTRWTGRARV
ncbi:hypothetical protein BJ875DRAFT_368992 [Amylocarpus encephaloides]|uniref:MARVEL domain-containing protein n=1 Tax=Amylocarpus encephaloides TaxID=45428 RepID=A0A9P8C8N1_9HELO|nr:hypothetical protein BJ875DRAFT_368992 [Amylocarpus encephaloides]